MEWMKFVHLLKSGMYASSKLVNLCLFRGEWKYSYFENYFNDNVPPTLKYKLGEQQYWVCGGSK